MADYVLPEFGYDVRSSQAVLQYGVGAMVNFPGMTLMTADCVAWDSGCLRHIHDERLEHRLGVNFFGQPDGNLPDAKKGVAYTRFPEWYSCPGCHRFMPIHKWVDEHGLRKTREIRSRNRNRRQEPRIEADVLYCPCCGGVGRSRKKLVPSRFITVCEHGHIDDFPWVEWVHGRNLAGRVECCAQPQLMIVDRQTGSSGLDSIEVSCVACGAKATLSGAFDENALSSLNICCTARHPWKMDREYVERNCASPRITKLRGASSVYFPIVTSSLSIPPYSSRLTAMIEGLDDFMRLQIAIEESLADDRDIRLEEVVNRKLTDDRINGFVRSLLNTSGVTVSPDDVRYILQRKFFPSNEDRDEALARHEEYEVLNGKMNVIMDDSNDFRRVSVGSSFFSVKQVSLLQKLREVQALLGYSRMRPSFYGADGFVSVKAAGSYGSKGWYPGYEVRGEGVFIEFDASVIRNWYEGDVNRKAVIDERIGWIQRHYNSSLSAQVRPRTITAKFVLLHTLSHLLLKQLSFECGYSIASLKERIYCSEDADGEVGMSGILIYTASGDSEGTLGGLVRQGQDERLSAILRKAVESAVYCSNDPVCSLSQGQGLNSQNNAACYSCALVPETSCAEERNTLLDRALLVGTVEDRSFGFFSPQLFNAASWKSERPMAVERSDTQSMTINRDATSWVIAGIKYRRLTEEERASLQNGSYCLFVTEQGAYRTGWLRDGANRSEVLGVRC